MEGAGSGFLFKTECLLSIRHKYDFGTFLLYTSLCLNSFHLLARKRNLEKFQFIQTNSFMIFTCPNPVLLVSSFGQVGK